LERGLLNEERKMIKLYPLRASWNGSDTYEQMEIDIAEVMEKHGAKRMSASSIGPNRKEAIHQIEGKGSILTTYASDQSIDIHDIHTESELITKISGVVTCLDFDERAEPFISLNGDLFISSLTLV